MPFKLDDCLVIAVSTRALFDLEKEHEIFSNEGIDAFNNYMREHENDILKPGTGFQLVKKLLEINKKCDNERLTEVIIFSRNYSEVSLRITKSISHYGLDISRSAWTGGALISKYLKAFKVDLLLSANNSTVQQAIDAGIAAARIYDYPDEYDAFDESEKLIKIAFDGDAVLFSDESERIYKQGGLEAFLEFEKKHAERLLPEGPFAKFLKTLSQIQNKFATGTSPIRTALVTSRGTDSYERVIHTLTSWDVTVNESFFLGGVEKYEVLKAFGADIFFDDQDVHCAPSSKVVPTAIVPQDYDDIEKDEK